MSPAVCEWQCRGVGTDRACTVSVMQLHPLSSLTAVRRACSVRVSLPRGMEIMNTRYVLLHIGLGLLVLVLVVLALSVGQTVWRYWSDASTGHVVHQCRHLTSSVTNYHRLMIDVIACLSTTTPVGCCVPRDVVSSVTKLQ